MGKEKHGSQKIGVYGDMILRLTFLTLVLLSPRAALESQLYA